MLAELILFGKLRFYILLPFCRYFCARGCNCTAHG